MVVKRKRRSSSRPQENPAQAAGFLLEVCPLCQREIPKSQRDLHHWVPKSKGGKDTTALHRICHRQIHAQFTETNLARHYNTPEKLLTHEAIQKFVNWVVTKPIDFYEATRKSRSK
jgi:HNH endonuclease